MTTTTLLLTGATGGLGRATSLEAARRGARLILLGRKPETLMQLADEVAAAGHHEPLLHAIDLSGAQAEDYAQLAELIAAHAGRLDGLLHLAADAGAPAPLAHVDPTVWNRLLRVNLTAPFLLTRACLGLLKSSAGKVVFIGDACEAAYLGAYGVAKAGLARQAAQWAEEQPGIHVELFTAPPMPTPLRARLFPGEGPAAGLTPVMDVARALVDRLMQEGAGV
ncbi:SDR family NAD(P)-dependent oxidoreductase [Thiofaba sp. EF100]|uniref:SDR family NAD(P)-dependent oxidoreductase n=1 Tax=Thiofaba sp. EF100 TaxID=3121274 RepID=UPI0032219308